MPNYDTKIIIPLWTSFLLILGWNMTGLVWFTLLILLWLLNFQLQVNINFKTVPGAIHQKDISFVNMGFHFAGGHRQWYLRLSAQQEMECEIEGRLQENITGVALDDTVHRENRAKTLWSMRSEVNRRKNFTWNERLWSYNKPQEQEVNTDQYDKW